MIRHFQTFRHSQTLLSFFGIRGSMLTGTTLNHVYGFSRPSRRNNSDTSLGFPTQMGRIRNLFGPLGALLANHGLSYPTPANLSYFWGFGSLSGLCLGLQLLSGIFLAMHYQAGADAAFGSVEHIMRNVQGG